MSATGSSAPAPAVPLPPEQVPAAVAKLLAAPGPMKLMAAKGMAPLRPAELLIALYQLTFDPDAAVRAAALASVVGLPDNLCAPPLGEPLPGPVIHLFARDLPVDRTAALERILYNPATGDETFVILAARLRDRELEVIFQNEARLLRSPAILEALYQNPAARMSSVNRAIELCARNGVRIEGIPAFDEIAKAISEDPAARDGAADVAFAGVLSASDGLAALPDGPDVLDLDLLDAPDAPEGAAAASPDAKKAGEKSTRTSPVIDFGRLKLYEKIRLATLGNAYCRANLMRDPNRMVAMAAIRSPRITDSEIVKAAGNRSVCEEVIRYIGNQRDLTKNYQVRLSLVQNPKCPVALSLKFLPLLQAEDLKLMARSKSVPGAVATGARRLMQSRKPE
jgi:hypothetical protein